MKDKKELNPQWRVELLHASQAIIDLAESFAHTGNNAVASDLLAISRMVCSGSKSANAECFGALGDSE